MDPMVLEMLGFVWWCLINRTDADVWMLVLNQGASVAIKANCGSTPLHSAMQNDASHAKEIVAILLGHGAKIH